MPSRSVVRANFFTVLSFLTALLGAAGLIWQGFTAEQEAKVWSRHTYDVLSTIDDLSVVLRDAERGQRGFLLTGRDKYLEPFNSAKRRALLLVDSLKNLTADNRAQQDRIEEISSLVASKLGELDQTVDLRRSGNSGEALAVVESDVGLNLMTRITAALSAMTDEERGLLSQRIESVDTRGAKLRNMIIVCALIALFTIAAAAWGLNQAVRRSDVAEAEQRTLAARLSATLEALSQGVAVFDVRRRLTDWNERFRSLLSLPSPMVYAGAGFNMIGSHLGLGEAEAIEREAALMELRAVCNEDDALVRRIARGAGGAPIEIRRTPMPDGGFVLTVTSL